MPEQVRLKVGGIPANQFAVYTEFARNIPGFQQMSERDAALFLPKTTIPVSYKLKLKRPEAETTLFFCSLSRMFHLEMTNWV